MLIGINQELYFNLDFRKINFVPKLCHDINFQLYPRSKQWDLGHEHHVDVLSAGLLPTEHVAALQVLVLGATGCQQD